MTFAYFFELADVATQLKKRRKKAPVISPLAVEAVRRIEKARAESATLLDLGDLPLEELPEELASLTELHVLALGCYSVRWNKDEVEWEYEHKRPSQRFSDLTILQRLTHLEQVSFAGCEEVTDLRPLENLALTRLDIRRTPMSDLSPLRAPGPKR